MYWLCILGDKSNGDIVLQQDLYKYVTSWRDKSFYNVWTNHMYGFYCNFILAFYNILAFYLSVLQYRCEFFFKVTILKDREFLNWKI